MVTRVTFTICWYSHHQQGAAKDQSRCLTYLLERYQLQLCWHQHAQSMKMDHSFRAAGPNAQPAVGVQHHIQQLKMGEAKPWWCGGGCGCPAPGDPGRGTASIPDSSVVVIGTRLWQGCSQDRNKGTGVNQQHFDSTAASPNSPCRTDLTPAEWCHTSTSTPDSHGMSNQQLLPQPAPGVHAQV